jgi:hypothetical protein
MNYFGNVSHYLYVFFVLIVAQLLFIGSKSDKKRLDAGVAVCDVEGQVVMEDIAMRL